MDKELESLEGDRLHRTIEEYLEYISEQQDIIGMELTFVYRQEFKEVKSKILNFLKSGETVLAKSLFSMIQRKFQEIEVKISELHSAIISFETAMKMVKSA